MATKPRRVDVADISHHQSAVNLGRAKEAGLKGIYHKTSEGDTMVDDKFMSRRLAARSVLLPFGGYHFARAERDDARAEAERFLRLVKPKPGDLVPALDLETDEGLTQKQLARWEETFSDVIEQGVGVRPVLYSPWSQFANGPQVQWVPRYNNSNTPPEQEWDMWQFSNGVLGVPNSYPGLGHCDLNTFGKGMTLKHLLIPKPEPTKRRILMGHASLQFSDTPKQQQSDADKLFARAQKRGLWWLTGTEAGGKTELKRILRETAPRYGYRVYVPNGTDSWIAVRSEVMTTRRWEPEYTKIVDGEAGKFTDKGPVSVSFDTVLGPITVIACHYLTHGRPVSNPEYNRMLWVNQKLADAIGRVAREKGKGRALVWYHGDQNIVDREHDTFLGAPLTSCWDELQRWQNTGHGNIDAIANYDGDGRAECAWAQAYDDTEFPLFTDHFYVEAAYDVGAFALAA